ncbi:MAG: cofactor assembly of complex C subunit B [Gloeocapsa sp. DLM2.Bin57]|nr:MAG: cofactor assembly of complex C subunit B [Gloeocapsa sp. DLM2.Bin57]
MSNPILSSTFCLTLLLMIGLFFFIRASVKKRIEELTLVSKLSQENLYTELQSYFQSRAYRLKDVNSENSQVTFEGFVRPSWFLAILLTILATIGLLSLSLVIYLLYPTIASFSLGLLLLAPLAGLFYWRKAGRLEQVVLNIQPLSSDATQIKVIAHRDELIALGKSLNI